MPFTAKAGLSPFLFVRLFVASKASSFVGRSHGLHFYPALFRDESHNSHCWSKLHGVTLLPQSNAEVRYLLCYFPLVILWVADTYFYLDTIWISFRWKFVAVQDTGPNNCMVRYVGTTLSRGQNHTMIPASWYVGPVQEAKLHVTSRTGGQWREAGLRPHTYPTEFGLYAENWCDKLNMRLCPSR